MTNALTLAETINNECTQVEYYTNITNATNLIMRRMTVAEEKRIGHRVVGTIKEVKGVCSAGHRVGDKIELSGHSSGGLCGFFYHDIFPYIFMLQFGGGFPKEYGNPDVIELECVDKVNAVKIELRRIKQ